MTRTSGKRNGNCGRIDFGFGRGGSVLSGHCHGPATDFPGWAVQYDAMACRPDYVDTDEWELDYFELSSTQAGRLTGFGSEPLLIIIPRDPNKRNGMSPRVVAQSPIWEREQEESKSLSPLSWRVSAELRAHGSAGQARFNLYRNDRSDRLFTWWLGTTFWHDRNKIGDTGQ